MIKSGITFVKLAADVLFARVNSEVSHVKIKLTDIVSNPDTVKFIRNFIDYVYVRDTDTLIIHEEINSNVFNGEDTTLGWSLVRNSNTVKIITTGPLHKSALFLPGMSGNYASSPDAAALDITGDIDLRAKAAPDNWAAAVVQAMVNKWNVPGDQLSYSMYVSSAGKLGLVWSEDGAVLLGALSTVLIGVPNGDAKWLRATLDIDNGASGRAIKFYTSDDGASWTQLGATVTQAGVTSIFSGPAILEVGTANIGTASLFTGKVYRAQVFDGIDGTLVFDAEFDQEAIGTTSFTESSSEAATVTINQSGSPQAEIANTGSEEDSVILSDNLGALMHKNISEVVGAADAVLVIMNRDVTVLDEATSSDELTELGLHTSLLFNDSVLNSQPLN